jgi:hypothetical protein
MSASDSSPTTPTLYTNRFSRSVLLRGRSSAERLIPESQPPLVNMIDKVTHGMRLQRSVAN